MWCPTEFLLLLYIFFLGEGVADFHSRMLYYIYNITIQLMAPTRRMYVVPVVPSTRA